MLRSVGIVLSAAMLLGPTVHAQTPYLLKDLAPGLDYTTGNTFDPSSPLSATSYPVGANRLFIAASQGGFITDGTPPGTSAVPPGLALWGGVNWRGRMYYTRQLSPTDTRVMIMSARPDGTDERTVSGLDALTAFNGFQPIGSNLIVMVRRTGTSFSPGTELWSLTGTGQDAQLLYPEPLSGLGGINQLVAAGDRALFLGNRFGISTTGQLWYTDGTLAGTSLAMLSINSLSLVTRLGDRLTFIRNGIELWGTGGNIANTARLVSVPAPWSGTQISTLTQASSGPLAWYGVPYYRSSNPALEPPRVWRTDGTPAGTTTFEFPLAGAAASSPTLWATPQGCFVLVNGITTQQNSLWFAPAQGASATLLATGLRACSSNAPGFLMGDKLVFSTDQGLCASDGTVAGTGPLLPDGTPAQSLACLSSTPWNNRLLIYYGSGVWISDGRPRQATVLFSTGVPGLSSYSSSFIARPDGFFLRRTDGLWFCDGSPSGLTQLVSDQQLPQSGYYAVGTWGSRLLFVLNRQLWITDGTPATTRSLATIDQLGIAYGSALRMLGETGNGFLLSAGVTDGRPSLWRITPDASQLIPLEIPGGFAAAQRLGTINGKVVFVGRDALTGWEAWSTDGTVEGTRLLLDATAPTARSSMVLGAVPMLLPKGVLMRSSSGGQFYITDGTRGGTTLLPLPSIDWRTAVFYERGMSAIINYPNADGTSQLVTSDGSPEGIRPITGVNAGTISWVYRYGNRRILQVQATGFVPGTNTPLVNGWLYELNETTNAASLIAEFPVASQLPVRVGDQLVFIPTRSEIAYSTQGYYFLTDDGFYTWSPQAGLSERRSFSGVSVPLTVVPAGTTTRLLAFTRQRSVSNASLSQTEEYGIDLSTGSCALLRKLQFYSSTAGNLPRTYTINDIALITDGYADSGRTFLTRGEQGELDDTIMLGNRSLAARIGDRLITGTSYPFQLSVFDVTTRQTSTIADPQPVTPSYNSSATLLFTARGRAWYRTSDGRIVITDSTQPGTKSIGPFPGVGLPPAGADIYDPLVLNVPHPELDPRSNFALFGSKLIFTRSDRDIGVEPWAINLCPADVAGPGGSTPGDGTISADDLSVFLQAFFAGSASIADIASVGGLDIPDGQITSDDLVLFLRSVFNGCP